MILREVNKVGEGQKNVPKLRFKGYEDAWEQRKLGDLCERVVRKNKNYESDLPLTIASQFGLIDQRNFFGKVVAAKDMSNYYLLKKGEFAYNKSYSKGFDFGSIKRLNNYDQGCLSTLYICFKISSNRVDSDYLEVYFDTLNWYKDVMSICAEGARNHGLLNVDTKAFFEEVNVDTPQGVLEQKNIALFLEKVDNLTTLHQRKYDALKTMKKTLLSKMFPKDGEDIPEIRFKKFTDAWEQRKLGEVGTTYTGLSGKTKEDFGHGNGQFITYMNVFSNAVASSEMVEPVEIDDRQNKVVAGDVLFTTSSETPEEVGMSSVWLENSKNTYLNSFCFGYRPIIPFDPYYLAFMLRSSLMRKKITFLAQGISRYNISKNKMMDIEIPVPIMSEQHQIGEYFRNLNNLITLHQRKLDELKNMKKTLLQQMFV